MVLEVLLAKRIQMEDQEAVLVDKEILHQLRQVKEIMVVQLDIIHLMAAVAEVH